MIPFKEVFVALLFLGLGVLIGKKWVGAPDGPMPQSPAPVASVNSGAPVTADPFQQKFEAVKQRFSTLNEVDIEEYHRLKDLEEKYLKAQEILSKIIEIFLTELGLRISENSEKLIQESKKRLERPRAEQINSTPTPRAGEENRELTGLRDQREISSFLKGARYADFSGRLTGSRRFAVGNDDLPRFEGEFLGKVVRTELKTGSYDMLFRLNTYRGPKGLEGKLKLTLAESGVVHADIDREGELSFIRQVDKSRTILVAVSPHYFQLYYLPYQQQIVGNYYYETEPGQYSWSGEVKLHRK